MKNDKQTSLHVRGVPKPLKKSFKAKCAENGKSMTKEVLRFMKKYVDYQLHKW